MLLIYVLQINSSAEVSCFCFLLAYCSNYQFMEQLLPTVRNHLSSWDQFPVHCLLHSIATAHSLHSPLFWTPLHYIELRADRLTARSLTGSSIDSLSLLLCSALRWTELNWTLARTGQRFYGHVTIRKISGNFSATPAFGVSWAAFQTIQVLREARSPGDAIPPPSAPATVHNIWILSVASSTFMLLLVENYKNGAAYHSHAVLLKHVNWYENLSGNHRGTRRNSMVIS
jgi:hypothetical protein